MKNNQSSLLQLLINQTIEQSKEQSRPLTESKAKEGINEQINNVHQLFRNGLKVFEEKAKNHQVSQLIQDLHQNSPDKIQKLISKITIHEFDLLLEEVVTVYDAKDFDSAQSMLAVMILLFPNQIKPYILLATLAWKTAGITNAILIYDAVLKVLKDPLLCYYAGDCFESFKDINRSRQLYNQGLDLCNVFRPAQTQFYDEIAQNLNKRLQNLAPQTD